MRVAIGPVFRYDGRMKKLTRNVKLRRLMKKHDLTTGAVCKLLHCSRTSVFCWTREPNDPNYSEISPAMLRLLELELLHGMDA